MARLRSLCVYCGSRTGADEAHAEAAAALGAMLAERGVRLIFGGGRVGLMGVTADAALAAGGEVVGVIPRHLHEAEVAHQGIGELVVVEGMHARKRRMFELSDAFAILPGGLGTLDEAIEMISWKQLGLHEKPIVLLDCNGYWGPFRKLVDTIVAERFAAAAVKSLYTVVRRPEEVFTAIEAAPEPPPGGPPIDAGRL